MTIPYVRSLYRGTCNLFCFFSDKIGDCMLGGLQHIWKVYIGGTVLLLARTVSKSQHEVAYIDCYEGVTNYWWLSGTAHMCWPPSLNLALGLFRFVLFACISIYPLTQDASKGNEGFLWDFPIQSCILVVTLTGVDRVVVMAQSLNPLSVCVFLARDQTKNADWHPGWGGVDPIWSPRISGKST